VHVPQRHPRITTLLAVDKTDDSVLLFPLADGEEFLHGSHHLQEVVKAGGDAPSGFVEPGFGLLSSFGEPGFGILSSFVETGVGILADFVEASGGVVEFLGDGLQELSLQVFELLPELLGPVSNQLVLLTRQLHLVVVVPVLLLLVFGGHLKSSELSVDLLNRDKVFLDVAALGGDMF
jgi:hypothetical protein